MNILKIIDGVPRKYSDARLKRENPDTLFPSLLTATVLADFDCYTYTIDPKPVYNATIQNLNPVFEQRADGWVQTWEIANLSDEAAKSRIQSQITADRWKKEQGGVEWLDSNFDLWRIATDSNSQQKMTSVLTMLIANPVSVGYSNWKMDKKVQITWTELDEDGNEIQLTEEVWQKSFRQNSLDEWNEMVALVSTHIKNCFDAESNALAKVEAGDLTVTFQSEFELL